MRTSCAPCLRTTSAVKPGLCALPALTCMLAAMLMGNARADTSSDSTGELKRLSLEELMDIQVTSVARHPEPLLQAAASIQVITREDIRRSGATSIPEALRLADNLDVAQKNSHDWGITARGFNTALSNKMLVMIDGRTVYTETCSTPTTTYGNRSRRCCNKSGCGHSGRWPAASHTEPEIDSAVGSVPPDVDRVLSKPPKLLELRATLADLTGGEIQSAVQEAS